MREIISIHVGQCGNQIADQFWRLVLQEHGLDSHGVPIPGDASSKKADQGVFFHRTSASKYEPRAVLVDLEPGVISRIETSDMGDFFDPGSIIKRLPGAANNWARGYHVEGERIIDQVMNVVDAAVEKTEALQGFIVTHSLGGGSGSGVGSLIIESLRKTYPNKKIFTFSVAPSALISDSAVEPYNAVLSLEKLRENADAVVMLDNEALFRIAADKIDPNPSYMDLNRIVGLIMSSVTCSLRFPGSLNTDLGEFLVNLVPFPGNHFLTASFAPMSMPPKDDLLRTGFDELSSETFNPDNLSAAIDYDEGVFLAACALFRGEVNAQEVDNKMAELRNKLNFASYIPTGIKLGVTEVAPEGFASSGLALVNHTGISQVFDRLLSQFDVMIENDAYTHWYENDGVSKKQLKAARDSISGLSQSYKDAVG